MKKCLNFLILIILTFLCGMIYPLAEDVKLDYNFKCSYNDTTLTFNGTTVKYSMVLTYDNNGNIEANGDLEASDGFKDDYTMNSFVGEDYYKTKDDYCPAHIYSVACEQEWINFGTKNYHIHYGVGGWKLTLEDSQKDITEIYPNKSDLSDSIKGGNCKLIEFNSPQLIRSEDVEDIINNNGGSIGGITTPDDDNICAFCVETHGAWKFIGNILFALKVIIPILIVVMGCVDLFKAVTANSEDEIKKSTSILIKRLIYGIIIFFIPTLINVVFSSLEDYKNGTAKYAKCITCLLEPTSDTCTGISQEKQTCVDEYKTN